MEFEDKIFKKCNLEHNDSISTYNGWGAQQNYNAFEVFHNFIRDVRPSQILEVGTSNGGFTQFLNYTCKKLNLETHIISLDIHEKSWYGELRDNGIDLRIKNVFLNNYTDIEDEYKEFIQSEGTTIVLCDGGNKIAEFNLLSQFLKSGDFILGHDYAYDRETFLNEINYKVWNWHELSESDIIDVCNKYNLVDYNRDIFQSVVWACKTKI